MPFYELNEFMRLSAVLNYQLCATDVNWDSVVSIILGGKSMGEDERETVKKTVIYLKEVYGDEKRKVGALSVLHPLRAAAMLAQTEEEPILLDLMTELLHDAYEDVPKDRLTQKNWLLEDKRFKGLVQRMSEGDQWYLMERIQWLTKMPGEAYYEYIGRLLDKGHETPEVVRVKLTDRLDNTLDMRIDLVDPLEEVDCFEVIFQILAERSDFVFRPKTPHPPTGILNGSERLYQLFKDTVLMSLVRQKEVEKDDVIAQEIFDQLARAGMKEAQRIFLHVIGYHLPTGISLRELVTEALGYFHRGGIDEVTSPEKEHRMDGMMMSYFNDPVGSSRKKNLEELYKNKSLMIQAALGFMEIFLKFRDDPNFYVRGVSEKGVKPDTH